MIERPENFKGIEFVRISTLPQGQQEVIWETLKHDQVIKILKENTLMNDCIQYSDYLTWYHKNFKAEVIQMNPVQPQPNSLMQWAIKKG